MSSGGAGGVVNTPVPVSTVSQAVTGQSTVSWQHNVGNEANAFLVVSVSLRAFAGVRTVTVTINGSTPVSLGTMMFTNNAFAGMYGSVAPPNSTMTVNVNVNNTTSIVGGSRLYANVDPTNPVTNTAGYTALVNGTSIGVTVPGAIATSGTRLVDTVALAWEYPMTAGATQTVDWNLSLASGSQLSAGASHAAGAGSDFTFNWAFTTQSACIVANALNPAR